MIDAEARRAIREDLDATLVVEAAAGTGKTTEMIARLIAVIRTGASTLDRIVAVTFTEKAAGEMKLRLRTELDGARRRATGVEADRFEHALAALEVARIGSIHSFCSDLLRERPLEACVDPLFEVAADDDADRIYQQAFDGWLQGVLAAPGEGVRRLLRRREPTEQLRRAGLALVDKRDFDGVWRRDPFDRDAALDHLIETLASLADFAHRGFRRDALIDRLLLPLSRWIEELRRREAVRGRDHDGLEAELGWLARWDWAVKGGKSEAFGDGLLRVDIVMARDAAKAELDAFRVRADADLAARLREELRPLVALYQHLLARAGKLDFLDLLLRTRDLLRDDPRVRAEMRARFTHFFVDEFQDTDPLQVEILWLLVGGDDGRVVPGKLFVVGDPKQAIYRFRRADVTVYESVKRRLVDEGARLVDLSTSFRAVPAIQSAVNAAFEPVMRGDGQARYVPLAPSREPGERTPIVALPVPRPYNKRIANTAIEDSYPDAVGAFVAKLVADGVAAPRDVCLMFRRFQSYGRDLTRSYAKALEARSIPHVLVGGRSFHEREEIEAVRTALGAIEWPDDELAVYATLRGPLFALHDEDLLVYQVAHGLHPLHRVDVPDSPVADAMAVLAQLHRERNRRPIADTLARLLAATRAHAGLAVWPAGEQALANVLRVLDLARRFEAGGATSFRAFVERLAADAERGKHPEAPSVEDGTEGVRVMTVHAAKGLEFPVVILCDPTAPLQPKDPSRHIDGNRFLQPLAGCVPVELHEHAAEVMRRDREEIERLAYVAVTRARDMLVVPVVGDELRKGTWLEPLAPVVYPQRPRQPEAIAGFSTDSVLDRPWDLVHLAEECVMPGRHVPRAGTHAVVWWDPKALPLGAEIGGGMRQRQILEADESGETAAASVRAHQDWQMRHEAARAAGGKLSLVVQSVTEAAQFAAAPVVTVVVEGTGIDRATRPAGKRFGSLVHAVLAAIELSADAAAVHAMTASQARVLGASQLEIDAAIPAVLAALAHPLMQRAAAAAELRREVPVILRRDVVVEGVVDLAFLDHEGWTVVDFKTDDANPQYEAQVALYAEAIAEATNTPTAAALLLV